MWLHASLNCLILLHISQHYLHLYHETYLDINCSEMQFISLHIVLFWIVIMVFLSLALHLAETVLSSERIILVWPWLNAPFSSVVIHNSSYPVSLTCEMKTLFVHFGNIAELVYKLNMVHRLVHTFKSIFYLF